MTGKEIKKARLAKGWSLRQLGEAVGASGPFIFDIERGNRNPSRQKALAIIKALDLPYEVCPQCGVGFIKKEKK